MSTALIIYTLVHVAISLAGIASGFVVIYDMLKSKVHSGVTFFFLTTTILTSVTGFGFPATQITPAHLFGVLSLIALSISVYALYQQKLAGKWRTAYITTAIFAQYLNVFVLIVQSFQKIPALHTFAPTGSEPAFAIAQGITLIAFIVLGIKAVKQFHPQLVSTEVQPIA
jgi:hypothetical protein